MLLICLIKHGKTFIKEVIEFHTGHNIDTGGDMREIKFRAWDKKNKVHIYLIGFCCNIYSDTIIRLWWTYNKNSQQLFNESFPIDQIILEQYTGLKDKNGKEIYEGDILRRTGVKEAVWETGECRYGSGAFRIHGFIMCEMAPYCEIIGNIHDTPKA